MRGGKDGARVRGNRRILFVRANLHDSTPAIPRAVEACRGLFTEARVACWNRRGLPLPRRERVRCVRIDRFHVPVRPRSAEALLGLILYQVWLLGRIIAARPDVVQVLDFESVWPACLLRPWLRYRLVYDMRDPVADCYRFPRLMRSLLYSLDWLAMGCCSAFVLPGADRRGYLGRWGRLGKPVQVVLNTCHDERKRIGDRVPAIRFPEEVIRVAFLGYLTQSRGSEPLRRLCMAEGNGVELVVAGSYGTDGLEHELASTPGVTLLGQLPRQQALALMRDSHVVALLYDPRVPVNQRACPNKFHEALCMGTPVLVSRGMALASLVERERLGWVVDYGDLHGLRRMVADLRKPERQQRIRRNCRAYFLRHFQLDAQLAGYRRFYENLLGGKPPAATTTGREAA